MWGLKPLIAAGTLVLAGYAGAEEAAYTLPGDMGGPGSAIRISRGPVNVPVTAPADTAPLPGNSAVRVDDILRERAIARAAAAEARLLAEAQAAAARRTRVVVLTQPWGVYRPVKRHGGFRLVIDKPEFFLSLGNGYWAQPLNRPKPQHAPGGIQAILPK